MFRPRRSSRPRRLAPPTGSRACCIPHPTLRFIGFPRTSDACLRPPPRFPSDACPPELFPSEKRSPRHREALPPCRSSATPIRLRGLVPLGNPWRRRLVAEPHRSMLSWASPLGAPPERDTLRHVRERTAMRGARGLRERRPIRWPSPRHLRHHRPKAAATPCARGRKIGSTSLSRRDAVASGSSDRHRGDVFADPCPQANDSRRPWSTSRRPARSSGASAVRRAGEALALHLLPRCPRLPCAAWCRSPRRSSVCSAAFREVGGRRRADPRCRWVDQVSVRHPGSGDRSDDPRIGEAKEGSSVRHLPGIRLVACGRISATRCRAGRRV